MAPAVETLGSFDAAAKKLFIVIIFTGLTFYLKFFKMSVKSLLGFKFSITLNSSMKKVLLSVIRELLKFYIK